MKINLLYVLIAIAVVISGTLSIMLLKNITESNKIKNETARLATPTSTQNASTVAPRRQPNPFGIPAQGSSQAVINDYWKSILLRSTLTTNVDIANCNPQPQIARLILGKPFTLANTSDKPHTIVLTESLSYTVPQHGKLDLVADFKKGVGIFDYICDHSPESVGVILISTN